MIARKKKNACEKKMSDRSEVNVQEIMRTIKARAAQRKASPEYQKIRIDFEGPDERPEWRELEHVLHMANSSAESLVKVPIATGKPWPVRWITMKVHRLLRDEINFTVDPTLRNQQIFNVHSVHTLNEFVKTLKSLATNVDQLKRTQAADTASFASELKLLNEGVDQLKRTQAADTASFASELKLLNEGVDQLKRTQAADTASFASELKLLNEGVDQLKRTQAADTASFASELKLLNEGIRRDTPSLSNDEYIRFEERYRGSYEEIQKRQRQYIRFFVNQPDIVVDLGCGRGEFLELLVKHGVPAYGVDTNHEMIAGCETRGLRAINEDIVAHLRSVSDDSLGGIFCAQTIEHLRPADQIELLRLCYRKLKHGRFLLVETVNPRCLSVFSESFYLDMTHIRPVHPETLSFLLSEVGFSKVEFIYSSPFPPKARLDKIDSIDENARTFNSNVEKLNNLLWGYQDYAVVATK